MAAEIEVRNAVTVVGHGVVLIGFVKSGKAAAGLVTQLLKLADGERSLVIKSVQRLSSTEGGNAVGLVFVNGPQLEDIRKAAPAGSILTLLGPLS